mmetsp:Transcript_7801/g.13859  ORF Transcript_7801/g.13859 Transcript_7801/m.13859 type:complete len:326 (+) Transcript_7801:70-1047(+)|eukprot:CAMPEP_0197665224 /NCGR_PEP_ID=MMETSP1338-20131121/59102_1 /TAXON_ID=43686 ORGANISM="Pelagodinium beii, Strain RCC1491" /NCGR_SAMPLE_ID=MMETSP1338 /ASSEMBLY_ACC=CAM_ASM_000754 /LENGTH=325 /DNA_ID=CAMNT_0043243997 /DNA_START=62 /DNA_END=1039 /DNA_ORIENTATION=+
MAEWNEETAENFLRPVEDLAAVQACFDRFGVVGVTGVLSREECAQLISEGIEPCLPGGCSITDPTTYDLADQALNRYGVLGKRTLFNSSILSARLHPNVVAAYKAVYGREDVYACHDRAAWMRPALCSARWDTPFSWPGLHFDVNLRSYFHGRREDVDAFLCGLNYDDGGFTAENNAKHVSMGRTVQGVLNLLDNEEEDGGFHCTPGFFGPALEPWADAHPGLPDAEPNGRYELKAFGPDAELGSASVRVPCEAGTLLLFDATLPHGTRPNVSHSSRLILFMRYATGDTLPTAAWRSRNASLHRVAQSVGFYPDDRQKMHMYGPE